MQRSYISVQRNPLLEPKYEFQGTPLISTGICLRQDSLSFQGSELIRLLGTFARGKWRGKAKDSSLLHTWVSQDTSTCQWLKFNHAKHRRFMPWRCSLDRMGRETCQTKILSRDFGREVAGIPET